MKNERKNWRDWKNDRWIFLVLDAGNHKEGLSLLVEITKDILKIRKKLTTDQLVKLQAEIDLADKLYGFWLQKLLMGGIKNL